jgi:HNH endonuclease
MTLCLFCPNELDGTTKPEHILLNALGGRKTTTSAICSVCNNKFGGNIDDVLASQVTALRNLLQLESGTGKSAPTLQNVQAGEHKVNIRGDGDLELVAKPFTIERLADGKWNVQIRARDEEHLAEIIPHLAAALKITEENLRTQLGLAQASVVSQRAGPVRHDLWLGGPDAIRSAVKSSLVLWSTLVGNDEVRSAAFDAARHFVLNGDEQFSRNRTHIDSRYFVEVERMKAEYGLMFNLIYVRSDAKGRVVGHFTLYNIIAWQFTLAETGGTPNAKIALISNPLAPGKWSGRAADDFDVPFDWLNSPDYSDEFVRSKARLDAILTHYFELNTPKEHARIIDECFKQVDIEPGAAVPPDKVRALSNLISSKLTHHVFGLPLEEKLSAEQIARMLSKK